MSPNDVTGDITSANAIEFQQLSLRQIELMLQLSYIRQNTELVKERLAIRNFKQPELVDEVLRLDDDRKKLQVQSEQSQSNLNSKAKEIGQLMAKGLTKEAEAMKLEVANLKSSVQPIQEQLLQLEKKLHEAILKIPNIPSDKVTAGISPADNMMIREGGAYPTLPKTAVPHWDLVKKYDLIDFETGTKITGSGFPLYKGRGAKLQRALIQYFLDYNIAAGYLEYIPPLMVNEATAYGTGQLPDKEGQMYYVSDDGFYLIPTAEVPVTNIYRDEVLKETDLPIKMTAYTPCFRREAGSFGKDVRGLNRVHQFDKVEVVQLVRPEQSYDVLEEMVIHVEKLLKSLELPYRILRLCGGDMGFTSAMTYDFEVYSAAQDKWLEVSSVSNFETYQSNRMKIRYKDINGKNQLVHTLNGSSLALPRVVACLLENNQGEKSITLPAVLHSYFGAATLS